MKRSLPNIKINSAGIGFILCLVVILLIGVFLVATGTATKEARTARTPTATALLTKDIDAMADVTQDMPDGETVIEKDLPPVLEDMSAPEPTETEAVVEDDTHTAPASKDMPHIEEDDIIADEDKSSTPTPTTVMANNDQPTPKIALVISDMGLSEMATETAIKDLPAAITLAFAPYADDLKTWAGKSKKAGHDMLISIPMEPKTFPRDDPGPHALLTSLPNTENITRLNWALSQTSDYVGIVNFMGSRFTANNEKLGPVIESLKGKDILFLDSASSPDSLIPSISQANGVPYAKNDRFIDNVTTPRAIDLQLAALENIARNRGQAIGIGFPYPVTFERVIEWSKTLQEKGIDLVPISDLMVREQ